jgi:hypothetical protein
MVATIGGLDAVDLIFGHEIDIGRSGGRLADTRLDFLTTACQDQLMVHTVIVAD